MEAPELIKKLRAVVPFQGKSSVAFLCHEAADAIAAADAERDAALALGVGMAAQHMSEQTRDEPVEVYVDSILSLAPVTPVEAALALPEVRELVEALRMISTRKQNSTWEPRAEAKRAFAKLEAKG